MKKYQAVLDKFKTLSDDFNISINLPIEIKDGNLIVHTKMIDITLQDDAILDIVIDSIDKIVSDMNDIDFRIIIFVGKGQNIKLVATINNTK